MKRKMIGILVAALVLLVVGAAQAAQTFPKIIPLPNGFAPEGIVTGHGKEIFAGSLATGAIYRADLRTGQGEIVVTPPEGRVAVGLSFDRRTGFVFAAGGGTGMAFVYNPDTGETAATYELTAPGTFINDVVVTRSAAYFTDSFRPFIYRLPLGRGGELPDANAVEEIELGGDYVFVPGEFNANGIDAARSGKWLILVHSSRGELYRVHADTGEATLIDLGGDAVPSGDGILLRGRTLYVVQNFLNQVAVVRLAPNLLSGEVTDVITDDAFRIPTTIASSGPYLYVVNARFDTPAAPDVEYEIVQVRSK